jgi:hypothetical protein
VTADDQVIFDDDTVYYSVKSVDSDTQITLTTNYAGTGTGVVIRSKPQIPNRFMNRDFVVAGHALREPSTTVTTASKANRFLCGNLTDFKAGDPVIVGAELATVRRTIGNILVLTSSLSAAPSAGTTVIRPAVSSVYLADRALTYSRDYSYSATNGTLTLTTTAEVNVAPILTLQGTSITMTNASRAVTGVATVFKRDMKPRDWIKITGESAYFEILSIESDTALTLRATVSGLTASPKTGVALRKAPQYYEEGKTVLSCDVLGVTAQGTTTGTFITTGPAIVEDLITRAGLASLMNTSTFTLAKSLAEQPLGLVIPEKFSDRKVPSHRDVIGLVNKSIFGALVQNEDFQLEYVVLNPKRAASPTNLKKGDVLKFTVTSDAERIVKTARVIYLTKEYDPEDLSPNNLEVTATSKSGNYLSRSTKEFEIETLLTQENDAQYFANRWAMIYGVASSLIRLETKLQAARFQSTEKVSLFHEKIYERIGSTDTRKIGAVSYIKQTISEVTLELDDIANCLTRCAVITANTAPDYGVATSLQKATLGFITDTYGMMANNPDTYGTNLIW